MSVQPTNVDQPIALTGTGIAQILGSLVASHNLVSTRLNFHNLTEIRLFLYLGPSGIPTVKLPPILYSSVKNLYVTFFSVDGTEIDPFLIHSVFPLLDLDYHFIIIGYNSVPNILDTHTYHSFPPLELQSGFSLSYEGEYMLKLIEDSMLLMRSLCKADDKTDVCVAAITFIKLRINDHSLIVVLSNQLTKYIDALFPSVEFQDSEDVLKILRSGLDRIEQVKDSQLYQKVYKLILYCLSLSLFEPLGLSLNNFCYDSVEEEAIRRKHHSKADFMLVLADSIVFLCERGQQALKLGQLSCLFHSGDTYSKYYEEVIRLQALSKTLDSTIGSSMDAKTVSFMVDLESAIEQGECIKNHATSLTSGEGKMVNNTLNALKYLKFERLTLKNALQDRPAPFSILLYGDSGIGKTSITNMLFTHFGKVRNLPIDDSCRYSKNPVAKYWDNFKETCWCIVFDDVAFMDPNVAKTGGDPSCMEIIQVINQAPFVPDQAKLEDKGRIPCRPELVLASTNTKDLNTFWYFSHPTAVNRRFPYIVTPRVKSMFARSNGTLDSSKVPPPLEGSYDDLWYFKIEKVIPVPVGQEHRSKCKFEVIKENCTLKEFLIWYNNAIAEHIHAQDVTMMSVNNTKQLRLCACNLPYDLCSNGHQETNELQVGWHTRFSNKPKINMGHIWRSLVCKWYPTWLRAIYTPRIVWEALNSEPDQIEIDCYLYTAVQIICFCIWQFWFKVIFYTGHILIFITKGAALVPMLLILIFFLYMRNTAQHTIILLLGRKIYRKLFGNPEPLGLYDLSVLSLYFAITWMNPFEYYSRWGLTSFHTMMRPLWYIMGQRVARRIGTIRSLLMLGASVGTAVCVYKVIKSLRQPKEKLQGDVISKIGTKPEKDNVERENVWYNDSIELTPFHVSPKSVSLSKNTDVFRNIIKKNLVRLVYDNGVVKLHNGGIFLKGNVLMTNSHYIKKLPLPCRVTILKSSNKIGVTPNVTLTFTEDIIKHMDADVCIIKFKGGLPIHADITDFFLKTNCNVSSNGYYIGRSPTGELIINDVLRIRSKEDKFCSLLNCNINAWECVSSTPTKTGDCGNILIAETGFGPVILGMHFAGAPDNSIAISLAIYRDFVKSITSNDYTDSEPILSSGQVQKELGPLSKNSCLRWIEKGSIEVYGSFPNTFQPKKSMVGVSPLADYLCERGFVIKHGRPVLDSWVPKRLAMMDLVTKENIIPMDQLKIVAKSYIEDVIKKLPDDALDMLKVYDVYTSINGAEGVTFVDKMKFNTSAGFPWNTTKNRFLIEDSAPMLFTDDIMDRVDLIWEKYRCGEKFNPVFTAHLKDEPVTFKKIAICKTRVMYGCPVDYAIVVRMLNLSTIKLIQTYPYAFSSAIGITCQGPEWANLYDYLTYFGEDNLIAGDFASFDRTMESGLLEIVGDIFHELKLRSDNFSEEELLASKIAWNDTIYPFINFFGDLVRVYGLNASGQPLTTPTNTIANCCYLRLAYLNLNPNKELDSYSDNVHDITYGDDHVLAVSDRVKLWYNHTTIQQYLKSIGITYTMADKDAESRPLINIKDVTFLKRSFLKYRSMILCPLEWDSIEKCLLVWTHSKSISSQEQAVAVISAMVREAFFHGEERFNYLRTLLIDCVNTLGLQLWINKSTFPTWDNCERSWYSQPYYPWRACDGVPVYLNYTKQSPVLIDTALNIHDKDYLSEGGLVLQTYQGVPRNSSLGMVDGWTTAHLSISNTIEVKLLDETNKNFANLFKNMRLVRLRAQNQIPIKAPEILNCVHCGQTLTPRDIQLQEYSCCWCASIGFQSGEELVTNVEYVEEEKGDDVSYQKIQDASFDDAYQISTELRDFLSRPLRIGEYAWNVGSTVNTTFYPWFLYLSNAAVKKKIDNYAYIQARLHLKFVINASPFYYGFAIASYRPDLLLTSENVPNDIVSVNKMIPLSQRPHVWLYPQTCTGGEMCLPFFYHKDWLDITSASDVANMGKIDIFSSSNLLNANSVAGTGVDITVFAWLSDVKLSGSTVQISLQSGYDEYTPSGIISKPASAVARFAKRMINMPYIGQYAKATEMISSAIGNVAHMFGFTNVPVISDSMPVTNVQFRGMASTEISNPLIKLTVDPKQELTIDSRVVGLNGEDEMTINHIATKESFLVSFRWQATDAPDTALFGYYVTPHALNVSNRIAGDCLLMTPMCHLGQLFAYWSGDIKIRLKVICSKYHKGRLLLQWDPMTNNLLTTANATNLVYSKVVDISEETDVEFLIPYHQATAFKSMPCFELGESSINNVYHGQPTPSGSFSQALHNGTFTVKVLNVQTSPVASADILVMVFVAGCDNLNFNYPIAPSYYGSMYQLQSGENPSDLATSGKMDNKLVYFGEEIVSVRQLMRRSYLNRFTSFPKQDASRFSYNCSYHSFLPLQYGYDVNGINTARNTANTATVPFNWTYHTAYSWMSPAYIGYRGSHRWTYNTQGITPIQHVSADLYPHGVGSVNAYVYQYVIPEDDNTNLDVKAMWTAEDSTASGRSLINTVTQSSNIVEVPMYGNVRCRTTDVTATTLGSGNDGSNQQSVRFISLNMSDKSTSSNRYNMVEFYHSIGTDLSLVFYINAPPVYYYPNIPTAT